VPERNLIALSGGEVAEGFEVLAAPGHASHHVVYVDPAAGDAFVGDVGGVRIPPGDSVWLPTPPPDIDLELWRASIELVAEREPERLLLTHYGSVDEPRRHLAATLAELERLAASSRDADREGFLAELEGRIDAEPAELAERTRSAMPPEQVWMGLERYWRTH
jgi:glyoxylase-like metal-dependent hydrolase (beta-lactamase superfamily II)